MSSDPAATNASGHQPDEEPPEPAASEGPAGHDEPATDEEPADEPAADGERAVDGQPADEEPADEEPAGEPDGPGPSLSAVARAARSRHLAWGVALVSLLVAIAAAAWAASVTRDQAQDREAVERAELVAEQVTTFDGAAIDEWVDETQALATGAYAEQVEGMFDTEFRSALEDNEVESTGEVTSAYLQNRDGDEALVFVVARQVSDNVLRDRAVEDELRMEITMVRENGEWYASDIGVLGPAPAAPGLEDEPGAEEGDAEEGGTDEGDAEEGDADDGGGQ